MEKSREVREPYERPRVVKIRLAADEMAAVACKTIRSGGQFASACVPRTTRPCFTPGS